MFSTHPEVSTLRRSLHRINSRSVKVVLYVDVGVQQLVLVGRQVHLVEDQILKGFLQVRLSYQHGAHHLAPPQHHLGGGSRRSFTGKQ